MLEYILNLINSFLFFYFRFWKMEFRRVSTGIIINREKKVMMCEHAWINNAWQFPQGGVEKGETEENALLRELKEELGTDKFVILRESKRLLRYHLPYYMVRKYSIAGQEMKFFLVYFYGDDSEIKFDNYGRNFKPEFKDMTWVDYDEPPLRVIYFKKLAYKRALDEFRDYVVSLDINELESSIEKGN